MKKILITNDDGIEAPGIVALAAAMRRFAETVVVAPAVAMSGCSHRVTTDRPLRIEERSPGWYAVDGTPADCVRLGISALAPTADWIVSGINDGANLGVDLQMSGTVAATREAVWHGRRAVAFSHYRGPDSSVHWERAAHAAEMLFELAVQQLPAEPAFWNVNFPDPLTMDPLPPVTICSVDASPLPLAFQESEGCLRYVGDYHGRPRQNGTDVDVCLGGGISVSCIGANGEILAETASEST